MYYITGDTHGDFKRVALFTKLFQTTKDDVLIILGDAGINYYLKKKDIRLKEALRELDITIFSIKGNHEKYPETLPNYKTKEWNEGLVFYEEEYPNLLFAKDGELYNIDGVKSLIIGGAYSVDKYYRLAKGYLWFEDEQPSEKIKADVFRTLNKNNWEVDVVLSHTCPFDVIPRHLFLDGIDQSTVDVSTEEWLQEVADKTKFKKWYFGHYHGNWIFDKYELMYEEIKEFKVE